MHINTHFGHLEALSLEHAGPLFGLVRSSKHHLYPWLPWSTGIDSTQEMSQYITQLLTEHGPQFVIYHGSEISGGIGFYVLDTRAKVARLGYWLGSEFIGRGIMADAVKQLCRIGFSEFTLKRIEILCATDNARSRKVAERAGFLLERIHPNAEQIIGGLTDQAQYSILCEEFELLEQ